jgi:putative oxidoreductase
MLQRLFLLSALRGGAGPALLLLRLFVGAFLVWGVWDNIISVARMAEFAGFLRLNGFLYPEVMAQLSVWAQFACGVAFVLGLGTRWAGWLCAVNFSVALVMVDAQNGIRAAFPAGVLVMIGLFLGTHGAGRLSLDGKLGVERRD